MATLLASMWLWSILYVSCTLGQKIVDTQYGPVQGRTMDVFNGESTESIDIFYGIPFAKDTSGENRFANPVPPDPWTDVFMADTLSDVCPQSATGSLSFTHPGWEKFSENCLNINIYSPDVSGGPYPVMVYIYGGGFGSGANIQYPGHFLATHGVVLAIANYRLNKFGFATTASPACPGNAGLFDQLLGLQFVIDNIAQFGGDPNQITVFGESAGAVSASLHIVSPLSKDLFHRAIMQSGTDTVPWAYTSPDQHPEEEFYREAARMGCPTTSDEEMLACMRTFTWQNLYENTTNFGNGPYIDGPGGFLPKTPEELREDGDIMTGPIISGINHDESSLSIFGLVPSALFGCCTRPHFKWIIEERIVGRILGRGLDNVTQQNAVEAIVHAYSPWPDVHDPWWNRNEFIEMSTDVTFGEGWNNQVSEHYKVGPTYAYVYNYRGRNTSQLIPEWMGVPHLGELPYTWGYALLPLNPDVIEDSMIAFDAITWTDEDVQHAFFAQKMWTNFAKTGNPTPEPVANPLGGTTVWPEFTRDETNVLIISNTSIEAETQYRQHDYYFLTDYLPYVLGQSQEKTRALLAEVARQFSGGLKYLLDLL